ncbi:electron transport complex subunit RsxG [Methylomonas methanica]|uniref:Ion-translocating oxidoreductase complex subunit G n=1 Tax=Methylomonas methanica (strain DSM 25384 / MC09) TaxID=857087 RepID=F9ZZ12_METMM|nr:electron transport complex subunit RsxG [Methylomonas methanica]AEF99867.1 electron transport complex, RnfABCDGE type, G subunit [Methylomonas methanica MC09]
MSSDPVHEQPTAEPPESENPSGAKPKLLAFLTPENLAQWRPKLSYQAGVLAVFALLASVLLGFADLATRDVIQQRLDEDLKASLEAVVPADLYDNDLLADTMTLPSAEHNIGAEQTMVYLAKKAGTVSAVCFKFIAPDGYAGPISLVMGVNRQGEILGVRVIAHVETPGLGDKIEIAKSKWVLGFNGKSLDNLTAAQWAVKKDGGVFDQFAGATITPRKVTQAIKRGLDFYQSHKTQLLGTGTAETVEAP